MNKVKFKNDKNGVLLSGNKLKSASSRKYKKSFNDMPSDVLYHDPLGARSPTGEKIDTTEEFARQEKPLIDAFMKHHIEYDFSIDDATRMVRKQYNTGSWNLPIHFIPEMRIVNPKRTPVADLIARETTNSKEVNVTEITGLADLEWDHETDTEYSTSEADTSDETYDVVGYYVGSRITDKLYLVNDPVRPTQNIVEQVNMRTLRYGEEKQIIYGKNKDSDDEWGGSDDSDGFEGFMDFGTKIDDTIDFDVSQDWLDMARSLVSEVEYRGGDASRTALIVDFDTFGELRSEIQEYARYNDPTGEIATGFSTLIMDESPVLKTSAIPKHSEVESGWDEMPFMFAVDMGSVAMKMLQDVVLTPLGKRMPSEEFATECYGTLISNARDHIVYKEGEVT